MDLFRCLCMCVVLMIFMNYSCAIDHQEAWNIIMDLDNKMSAEVDTSCAILNPLTNIHRTITLIFDIKMTHYGPQGITVYPFFIDNGKSLIDSASLFDQDKQLVVIVYSELDTQPYIISLMAAAFKAVGLKDILAIDYGKVLASPSTRAEFARYIGEGLAIMLRTLTDNGVNIGSIHLIGHEVGAQVVGFAGKAFKILSFGQYLPRITVLNPSYTCFSNVSEHSKLAVEDAKYLEAIYTVTENYLKSPIGDINFYIVNHKLKILKDGTWNSIIWNMYAEAIKHEGLFKGIECESLKDFKESSCTDNRIANLAYMKDDFLKGSFIMRVELGPPYGLGVKGLKTLKAINLEKSTMDVEYEVPNEVFNTCNE